MTDTQIAEKVLLDFIKEMNKWEKECNKIEDDDDLDEDEQFSKQKELLIQICNKFCTSKERLDGRPNTISYGDKGSYEYDPKEEKVISIEQERSNRIEISTNRKKPMGENFIYVLLKEEGSWLLDSKKRESAWEKKWKVVSL